MRNNICLCCLYVPNLTHSELCALCSPVCGTQLTCTHSTHKRHGFHKTDIGSNPRRGTTSQETGVAYPAITGAHGANAYPISTGEKKGQPQNGAPWP